MLPRPLFVIAQGRTGSTFLWQVYDSLPGLVGFLEPLHPHMPDLVRGKPLVDPALRHNVSDHWGAYRRIDYARLAKHAAQARIALQHPPLEPDGYEPIADYVQFLVEQTAVHGARAVLQFNRLWGPRLWCVQAKTAALIHHHYRSLLPQWHSAQEAGVATSDFFGEIAHWLVHEDVVAAHLQGFDRFAWVWSACIRSLAAQGPVTTRTHYESLLDAPLLTFEDMLRPLDLVGHASALVEMVRPPKHS